MTLSLTALDTGGETYKDVGMSIPVSLSGTSNKTIKNQLSQVASLWQELQDTIDGIDSQKYDPEQLMVINKLSVKTLASMNKAVGMFADEAVISKNYRR